MAIGSAATGMKSKSSMRIDYLTSNEERQLTYGGKCQKLNALICSLLGIAMMVTSFLLLRHDRLRIQNYLNVDNGSPYYYTAFPEVLRGCAAATIVGSVVQIISSLMFMFEDISLGVWKWLKFIVLLVSSMSVMILMREEHAEIHQYRFYFVLLIVNSSVIALFLTGDVFCGKCRSQPSTVRSY